MFDAVVRDRLERPLDRVASGLDRSWVTPDRLTLGGLVVALASAGLAAMALWPWAVATWLLSRLLDGLDGPLARRRGGGTAAGGFLDITADFVAYGAGVVGIAWACADRPWEWLGFLAVLLAYYVNGAAFLAFSSAAERTGSRLEDGRTFSFLGGLAEGTETIVVHTVWMLLPASAPVVAWGWAGVVGVSAAQRMLVGHRVLGEAS